MPQIVTKQSLNALATLAFQALNTDETTPSVPEYNLDAGAACKLHELLSDSYGVDHEDAPDSEQRFFFGYVEGVELGLSIAAALVTNALDSDAARRAVKSEIDRASQHWPEEFKQQEEAA